MLREKTMSYVRSRRLVCSRSAACDGDCRAVPTGVDQFAFPASGAYDIGIDVCQRFRESGLKQRLRCAAECRNPARAFCRRNSTQAQSTPDATTTAATDQTQTRVVE